MRQVVTIFRYSLLAILCLVMVGVGRCSADPVLDWNSLMIDAIRIDNSGPTLSSRNLAILHTAIFDAVNSVTGTHQPYRFKVSALEGTSAEAAAVGAGYLVCRSLYPSLEARSQDLYETYLSSVPASGSVSNGIQLGFQVAELTLQDRSSDGSSTEVPYIPSDAAGQWRRTPPFFRPPVTPQWRYVRPFALDDIESFAPPPPPALNSPEYAAALNEVKELGGKVTTKRTAEQTQIAVFWSDFSYTSMPPGHWHLIAETISRSQQNTLEQNARLFALLSMAQADGAIVCWEAKYRYNLWRPVTAIQRADEDDNELTQPDKTWDHLLASPPFPAYTSGHSTFSKSSSQVLTHFYGTDAISFPATSDSLPGVIRNFSSLAACADEVGMSRIYGGIHYSFDNIQGKKTGGAIGDYVSANFLHPNDRLPFARLEAVGGGVVRVRVHGHWGKSAVLQSSSDLVSWSPVASSAYEPGGWVYSARTSDQEPARFFRVRED